MIVATCRKNSILIVMRVFLTNRKMREAMFAGLFYPEDKAALLAAVEKALTLTDPLDNSGACAILSPHAALSWAGSIQAQAWVATRGKKLKHIVIFADLPKSEENCIILPESSAFDTPLGEVPIDTEICEELETCGTMFATNDIPHLQEHAIEVHLPFIKYLFPQVKIVPVLLAGKDPRIASTMARALDHVFGDKLASTLFVASSNIGSSIIPEKGSEVANRILECIETRNIAGLHSLDFEDCRYSVQSISTILRMQILEHTACAVLKRLDSGRMRDNSVENIVHYAAAGWFE